MKEGNERVWRARLGRVALALFLPPLLIELLLQLGSLGVALFAGERGASDARGCAVLCVGDSFTWGFGASNSDRSYPGQLERSLKEAPLDGDSRVVNGGWPGRDSRAVLAALPAQLAESHPRFVAVLMGVNDRWSQPAAFHLDESQTKAPSRFRLEWRTGRLLQLVLRAHHLADAAAPDAAAAGKEPGSAGATTDPTPTSKEPKPRRIPGKQGGAKKVAHPELMREARAALASNRADRFVPATERWLAAEPDEPRAHELRAEAAIKTRDDARTQEEVGWLRHRVAEAPELVAAESLVRALTAVNLLSEAGAVAAREVERTPDSALLWTAVATSAMNVGDEPRAEQAISRAIELSEGDADAAVAWRLHMRAKLRMKHDALAESASDLLQAYCLDGDADALALMLRARRDSFTPAMFEAAGRELGIAQEPIARAIQVLAETVDPANRGGPEVLADHLRQLVAFCRSHGAEPIVLGYPFHTDTIDRIQRDVAAELHATFVPLAPKFDELLRGRDRSELFVADGHCNDAGYAVMAQEVAAALRTRAGAPAAR